MNLPKSKTENIVCRQLEGEILIYDLSIDKAFCLNETAAIVYQNCDGINTVDKLKKEHKLPEDLVYLALDKLREENLLEEDDNYASPHAGISRRDVIRRAGFTSLAVLPLISVIIAPQAANAASAFAPGSRTLSQSCNTATECASSAPNCANRSPSNGQKRCCAGSVGYYDTGGVVNSCSGGTCSSATFSCQSDANQFCCSNSASASCTGNSCACRCN